MNTVRMTFRGRPPNRNISLQRGTIRHLVRASMLFVFSATMTLALVHFLLQRLIGHPLPLSNLIKPDIFWPTLALAAAVTLANYTALSLLDRRIVRKADDARNQQHDNDKTEPPASTDNSPRQLDHLNRSADRLDLVEQDLIRKISLSYPIDSATQRLLTEMRICTNRLRGELSDIERFEPDTPKALAGTGGSNKGDRRQSSTTAASKMKFDNIPVG